MLNLFRSFFMVSFFAALIGLFMVTLVHVTTNTGPSFAKLPEPTAYIVVSNKN